MPFPFFIFLIQTYTNPHDVFYFTREEEEFDFSRDNRVPSCRTGKVSVSTSRSLSGSITVEAVICLPFFLYAALSLIWLLEIRTIQTTIRCGLHSVGKQMAESAFSTEFVIPGNLESEIVNIIGEERLERSIVVGGSEGISCKKSYCIPGSGIYELKAQFRVRLPFPYFNSNGLKCEESMRIKGWNGYVKELFTESSYEDIVYVTENGVVYHLDARCTYLEPSVRSADMGDIENLRNDSGGKYYECPLCVNKNKSYEIIYITDYGYRYHAKQNCSGIKRKVYAVPKSEVKGKVACSKCGN